MVLYGFHRIPPPLSRSIERGGTPCHRWGGSLDAGHLRSERRPRKRREGFYHLALAAFVVAFVSSHAGAVPPSQGPIVGADVHQRLATAEKVRVILYLGPAAADRGKLQIGRAHV